MKFNVDVPDDFFKDIENQERHEAIHQALINYFGKGKGLTVAEEKNKTQEAVDRERRQKEINPDQTDKDRGTKPYSDADKAEGLDRTQTDQAKEGQADQARKGQVHQGPIGGNPIGNPGMRQSQHNYSGEPTENDQLHQQEAERLQREREELHSHGTDPNALEQPGDKFQRKVEEQRDRQYSKLGKTEGHDDEGPDQSTDPKVP